RAVRTRAEGLITSAKKTGRRCRVRGVRGDPNVSPKVHGGPMKSLADRFRRWYDYERDCNAKSLEMLASVPAERRSAPEFQKAVDRMAHLVVARRRWLHRLGDLPEAPGLFPQGTKLAELPALSAAPEGAWVV